MCASAPSTRAKSFQTIFKGPPAHNAVSNYEFEVSNEPPRSILFRTMTTRGRVIAPPAPFNVEDGSSGVRRTEPRRKKFMDRGIHPTLEGAAGGSTQHWKEPPKGCACISEYYRPGLTIQHWTRLCTQRIEKILMLWPVQTFHKGPHGISGQRNPLTSRFPWKLQTYVHVCRWGPGVPPLQHQYLFNTSTICICTCSVAAMPRQDGEGGAVFSG